MAYESIKPTKTRKAIKTVKTARRMLPVKKYPPIMAPKDARAKTTSKALFTGRSLLTQHVNAPERLAKIMAMPKIPMSTLFKGKPVTDKVSPTTAKAVHAGRLNEGNLNPMINLSCNMVKVFVYSWKEKFYRFEGLDCQVVGAKL
jgi:hypothetical protein